MSLVVVAVAVVGTAVPLPYYLDAPGSVRATQPLISITGRRAYESKGVVMYTTVNERRATPFLVLRGWLDDAIDVLPAQEVNPTGDRDAQRRFEQARMDESKLAALTVAFDRLGIPIEITGTGALIQQVLEDAPAAEQLDPGDVITAIDGTAVTTIADVTPLVKVHQVGDVLDVTVRRVQGDQPGAGPTETVAVTLTDNEGDTSRGYLGVMVQTADEQVKLPFEINLDSGSVIGPSAGLAWTLGVIDRLTPGSLTQGRTVAVTGTIDQAGNVGTIGGIAQKVVGAKEAGATLFLYPEGTSSADVARMRSLVGDDVRLVPVATVDDALDVLDPEGLGAS